MSNDKQNFDKWLSEQQEVEWDKDSFIMHLTYKEVRCAGIITKVNGKIYCVAIRPMRRVDDIGNGCGSQVTIEFEQAKNKSLQP